MNPYIKGLILGHTVRLLTLLLMTILALLISFIIYNKIKDDRKRKWFVGCLMIVYLIVVFYFTLFSRTAGEQRLKITLECFRIVRHSITTFSKIVNQYYEAAFPILENQLLPLDASINIVFEGFLNIVLFVPLGFFLPMLCKRVGKKEVAFYGIALSLCMEIFQAVFRLGTFDIDDLLHNTMGALLGWMLLLGIRKIMQIRVGFRRIKIR